MTVLDPHTSPLIDVQREVLTATKLVLAHQHTDSCDALCQQDFAPLFSDLREECRHTAQGVADKDSEWNFNDPNWQDASYEEGDSSCNCGGLGYVPTQDMGKWIEALADSGVSIMLKRTQGSRRWSGFLYKGYRMDIVGAVGLYDSPFEVVCRAVAKLIQQQDREATP